VKRYEPKVGLHGWHVDRSSASNCREIAALFYLNDLPGGGGETLFRTPTPRAVAPRKGRLLLFPAGPSHVHAGAPAHADRRYLISNFINSCDHLGALGVAPAPPLSALELTVVRTHFSRPPRAWATPADGSGEAEGVPWPLAAPDDSPETKPGLTCLGSECPRV